MSSGALRAKSGAYISCPLQSHLFQAAPTGLLDQLLCIHFFPNVVSHVQCCLLEELGGSTIEERSEVLLICIDLKKTEYEREAFLPPLYRREN